jgi:hypothetical protein
MSRYNRRPSLLGALLWIGLGVVFLLRNFNIGPDFWSMAGRYWPILLILLGLGKVIDYFRGHEGVSIRAGEIIGIFLLLIVGSFFTKTANTNFGRILSELPISIGDESVRPGHWIGNSYSYNEEASYTIPTNATLRIENSYGLVSVSPGSDSEVKVRLRKVVYNNDESRAKSIAGEIKLEGGAEAQTAAPAQARAEAEPAPGKTESIFVVRTNRDSLASRDYRFNTEMEVYVPKKAKVMVRNSFGELRAVNLEGALDLGTSHEALEVHDCTGTVMASNRYAATRLINIGGDITVEARGRVYAETVKGNLSIRNEYAPVEVRDISGVVKVSNTDSSVSVEKAAKAEEIDAPGCQVTTRELQSTLKLGTSHKRVQISDVASNVTLDTRYANVTIKDVKGNLEIASNSDRINVDKIAGHLIIKAQGSGIQADSITGPVDIATTHKDVAVNNFEGACKVTNEYGEVTLSTGSLGKGDLSVTSKNGDIQLLLPASAAFQIEATARNGRVDTDFAGLEPVSEANNTGSLKAKVKAGGTKIVLNTEYSNIHLRSRSADEEKRPEAEEKPKPAKQGRITV